MVCVFRKGFLVGCMAMAGLHAGWAYAQTHESKLYGKLNLSLERQSVGSEDSWVLNSNASRLGIKGKISGDDTSIDLIYQLEYQVYPDDGKAGSGDATTKQRNSYAGIAGSFGKVIAGYHDTPVKKAQLKVDVFNDSSFDIKYFLEGENRVGEFIQYESPVLSGVKFKVAAIVDPDPQADLLDSSSVSVEYNTNGLSLAFAVDDNVDSFDNVRASIQWKTASGLQLGALINDSSAVPADSTDTDTDTDMDPVVVLSAKYRGVYGQYVSYANGDANFWGFGYALRFHKNAKVYFWYGDVDATAADADESALATGIDIQF